MAAQNKAGASNWGNGLVDFAQKVGITVGGFSLVVGVLYFAFVQTPINNLSNRIEKLESKFEMFLPDVKRDIAVIKEQQKFISITMTEIKNELKKEKR